MTVFHVFLLLDSLYLDVPPTTSVPPGFPMFQNVLNRFTVLGVTADLGEILKGCNCRYGPQPPPPFLPPIPMNGGPQQPFDPSIMNGMAPMYPPFGPNNSSEPQNIPDEGKKPGKNHHKKPRRPRKDRGNEEYSRIDDESIKPKNDKKPRRPQKDKEIEKTTEEYEDYFQVQASDRKEVVDFDHVEELTTYKQKKQKKEKRPRYETDVVIVDTSRDFFPGDKGRLDDYDDEAWKIYKNKIKHTRP